ncbi:MAG: hypothetical protein JW902_15465 [Syntrophaceae bacterium]|nr:hypothetical protein [Syntrophaceae bacterium]
MKVYFHFALHNHTLICHEMAKHWNRKYGWVDFAGLMGLKGGNHYQYLLNQPDIKYRYLDVIESIEKKALQYEPSSTIVEEWERRIDSPLWHLVLADRNIGHHFVTGGVIPRTYIMEHASHSDIAKFVCFYLEYFERRLSEFKPDFVFFTVIAALPALALAKVCQWKNIPFYTLESIRIGNRYVIGANTVQQRITRIEDRYREQCINMPSDLRIPEELSNYIESFKGDSPVEPIWAEPFRGRQSALRRQRLGRYWAENIVEFVKMCRRLLLAQSYKKNDLRHKKALSAWLCEIKRRRAIRRFDVKRYDRVEVGQEPYVLFPLHLDPEASTMVLAPNYVNQLNVIDCLAKNIPLTHKLYVKEHPTMVGRRPRGYYKQLRRYPNLRIISPSENIYNLIKKSSLTAIITGTAGLEAMLMGKLVLTFGSNFFSHVGLSERCGNLDQIGKTIKRMIFNDNDGEQMMREKKLRLFLNLLYEESFTLPNMLWKPNLQEGPFNSEELEGVRSICSAIESLHGEVNEIGAVLKENAGELLQ